MTGSRPVPLTDKQRVAFDLRQNGLSYQKIGKAMGVSDNSARIHVFAACEKLGVPALRRAKNSIQPDSYRIWALHEEGKSREEIMEIVGKSRASVRHVIARFSNPYSRKPKVAPDPVVDEPIVVRSSQFDDWDVVYQDADVSRDRSVPVAIRVMRD